jgi:hypothetical protein
MTRAQRIETRARELLDAFGGDMPGWLAREADALRRALAGQPDPPDDGERDCCEECGDSFNVNDSGCEDHCTRCAGPDDGCAICATCAESPR